MECTTAVILTHLSLVTRINLHLPRLDEGFGSAFATFFSVFPPSIRSRGDIVEEEPTTCTY